LDGTGSGSCPGAGFYLCRKIKHNIKIPCGRDVCNFQNRSPKVTIERSALVLRILKVPGSNLDPVKLKVSPCLIKRHAMKTYWGAKVQFHSFLTSALDGGEWSASHPGRFTCGERASIA
jgi:hypothetical protein